MKKPGKGKGKKKIGYNYLGMIGITTIALILLGGLMVQSKALERRLDYYDSKAAALETSIENEKERTKDIDAQKEYMKTDIREYQNKYIMEIDLPGLKKEDIIINYENGYLTIKATKTVSLKVEAYIRRERFYGEVKRSFYIGEKKESDIKANYESGILTITFPKEDILKNEKQNIMIK